jgi:hypothetical protein
LEREQVGEHWQVKTILLDKKHEALAQVSRAQRASAERTSTHPSGCARNSSETLISLDPSVFPAILPSSWVIVS